ncbi:hypothetical protein OH76DRAFT_1404564 [Lentinus brumalis]|uniref:Uncharacterized protein n=1 Tax=Lentinus brumalis TaxID=2498619 RepID=A0A371D811_9APHY|nr:hypothetical protein OH76DRAFT_1404564 [Polyporus brumalis]
MHKLFFPLPMTYAVVQLDVEGTLQGLDPDAEALDAARALRPLKCLVYLRTVLELPFPRNPDFKYDVYVVGPGLRPADEARCITKDMCVPIFPATDHPTGRAPVHPKPEFPFSNCYHWFGPDTHLEVRIKQDIYDAKDDEIHVLLSGVGQVHMDDRNQEDTYRMIDSLARLKAQDNPTAPDSPREPSIMDYPYDHGLEHDADLWDCDQSTSDISNYGLDGPSAPECHAPSAESDDDTNLLTSNIDVFGMARDSQRAMIPVVDCWLHLPAHIKDGEIPDPFAFVHECRALSEIVKELQARQAKDREDPAPASSVGEVAESRGATVLERLKGLPAAAMKTVRSIFRVQ